MNSEIVTIYTKPVCVQCTATKRALEAAGIHFLEVPFENVSDEQIQAFKDSGLAQAPVVVTPAGEVWAGFRPDRIKQQ